VNHPAGLYVAAADSACGVYFSDRHLSFREVKWTIGGRRRRCCVKVKALLLTTHIKTVEDTSKSRSLEIFCAELIQYIFDRVTVKLSVNWNALYVEQHRRHGWREYSGEKHQHGSDPGDVGQRNNTPAKNVEAAGRGQQERRRTTGHREAALWYGCVVNISRVVNLVKFLTF